MIETLIGIIFVGSVLLQTYGIVGLWIDGERRLSVILFGISVIMVSATAWVFK